MSPRPDSFLAIDFETADQGADSACAVGLVRVEGDQITHRAVALIRPPRPDVVFTHVHGLTWSRLRGERPFRVVWPTLAPLVDGVAFLAAHNAPFDRRVLEACCAAADLRPPALPWVCTLSLSRRRWPKPARNALPDVCERLKIPFAHHHEALADAEAAARVLLVLRTLDPDLTPAVDTRAMREAPTPGPYWAIGEEPPSRADLPGHWRMLPFRAGERCPVWMTHWCIDRGRDRGVTEWLGEEADTWTLFGPTDETEWLPPEDRPESLREAERPAPTLFS